MSYTSPKLLPYLLFIPFSLIFALFILLFSYTTHGVTLLAFVNGSTDLISGILAALNTIEGDEGEQQGIYLAIGGLVGAAVINVAVVTGLLILTNQYGKIKVYKDQFLKDAIFLCFVALISLLYLFMQRVTLTMAIFFLVIYAMQF